MTDIDKMIETMAEMREVIRSAHEATKDLKSAIKEAKELKSNKLANDIDAKMNEILQKYVEETGQVFSQVTEEATNKVYKRFDTLAGILLGDDYNSKRQGHVGLLELCQLFIEENGPMEGLIDHHGRKASRKGK